MLEHAFEIAAGRIRRGNPARALPRRSPAAPAGTLVGWSPCDCTSGVHGHRTYTCRFIVNGAECGRVLSFPPCRDPSAGPSSWV
jgi:hypothetical protein